MHSGNELSIICQIVSCLMLLFSPQFAININWMKMNFCTENFVYWMYKRNSYCMYCTVLLTVIWELFWIESIFQFRLYSNLCQSFNFSHRNFYDDARWNGNGSFYIQSGFILLVECSVVYGYRLRHFRLYLDYRLGLALGLPLHFPTSISGRMFFHHMLKTCSYFVFRAHDLVLMVF